MFPTLITGAASCLLSGSVRAFSITAVALLIFLYPFRALVLVAVLVLAAIAAALVFNIVRSI